MDRQESSVRALELRELITGYWAPHLIYIVSKLGVADYLVDGTQSVEHLASMTRTRSDLLYRILRALSSRGVFQEVQPRCFALTPLGDLLRTDHPESLRYYAIFYGEESFIAFTSLLSCLSTNEIPFEKKFGEPYFDYLSKHPESQNIFNRAMKNVSAKQTEVIARECDFSGYKTICDVGGGTGALLFSILRKYPNMKGILFDIPGVADSAETPAELMHRCEIKTGDFFKEVPEGADAYLLKYIIHDWGDEDCRRILSTCRRSMKSDTSLFIIDQVILPGNSPQFAKLADLHLYALLGGKERTESEFKELLASSGFTIKKRVDTSYLISLFECTPI